MISQESFIMLPVISYSLTNKFNFLFSDFYVFFFSSNQRLCYDSSQSWLVYLRFRAFLLNCVCVFFLMPI